MGYLYSDEGDNCRQSLSQIYKVASQRSTLYLLLRCHQA